MLASAESTLGMACEQANASQYGPGITKDMPLTEFAPNTINVPTESLLGNLYCAWHTYLFLFLLLRAQQQTVRCFLSPYRFPRFHTSSQSTCSSADHYALTEYLLGTSAQGRPHNGLGLESSIINWEWALRYATGPECVLPTQDQLVSVSGFSTYALSAPDQPHRISLAGVLI